MTCNSSNSIGLNLLSYEIDFKFLCWFGLAANNRTWSWIHGNIIWTCIRTTHTWLYPVLASVFPGPRISLLFNLWSLVVPKTQHLRVKLQTAIIFCCLRYPASWWQKTPRRSRHFQSYLHRACHATTISPNTPHLSRVPGAEYKGLFHLLSFSPLNLT